MVSGGFLIQLVDFQRLTERPGGFCERWEDKGRAREQIYSKFLINLSNGSALTYLLYMRGKSKLPRLRMIFCGVCHPQCHNVPLASVSRTPDIGFYSLSLSNRSDDRPLLISCDVA